MPRLSAVEAGPHIAVVGGELACITLRGPHGVLASGLGVRGLWACHLGLSPILHWGLRSWCSVAEASWFLKAILLAGLAFQKLMLVILPFFGFGPFCKNDLVHQGVEVQVDLRGNVISQKSIKIRSRANISFQKLFIVELKICLKP